MKTTRWYGIIFCLIFSACERTVELDIPYEGDKLVVNGFIQPDSVVYLRVTRSQPPGGSEFPEVRSARVELKAGAEILPLQWQVIGGKGYFVSAKPAKPGVEYNISVSAAGLDTVTARDTLPRKPLLAEPFAQAGGNRVKFVMKDIPGADYYRFRLFKGAKNGNGETTPVERRLYRFDPSYNNSFTDMLTENYLESTLIADDRFDGRELTIVMQTKDVNIKDDILLLEVTGLTSNSWLYLKTLEVQTLNEGNILIDPSKVYTNVVKGYGILGGVNAARLEVTVK
ncbi:DUF4249 domain-containing protein [Chitinophaga sp. GCM10012297]|uniref:DUF4249 domain-containing protein n=1 Tax=Chitinophaga chungangae TaxID=2821488 RepID=A0ABS3YIU4_9BACT|nr:DUF4249 domain-containing protein [Chitinophaga chungangae]MBO9154601.1 DUF4249 domain-containing protein [Chitinophaga chungangae]